MQRALDYPQRVQVGSVEVQRSPTPGAVGVVQKASASIGTLTAAGRGCAISRRTASVVAIQLRGCRDPLRAGQRSQATPRP